MESSEKRVAEYFVVAGLPQERHQLDELSQDGLSLKPNHKQDPITDVVIINKSLGEFPPPRYRCVDYTPAGFPADLNHGSIRAAEMYLCYKRGRDKPPLTDVGVLYEGKERVKAGCEVIYTTPHGRSANVNNSSSSRTYVTYRRASEKAPCDVLAVTDICVIIANKGETPPHAFCQINKTLNKGMMGSDVYLCYKKSMAKTNYIAYSPGMLGRYPSEDNPQVPLPETVPLFCMPLGATVEAWPIHAQHPMPVFSTFVLTGATGAKMYGAAVTFYEDYTGSELNPQEEEQLGIRPPTSSPPSSPTSQANKGSSPQAASQNSSITPSEKTLHQNKCICILSRWPFFDTFKKFLMYIYRISICGPHSIPLERHISHFMTEVPFPSPQRPRILVHLSSESIALSQPEDIPLPQSTLLKNLGPENCMNLLLFTLLEQKILIHSLRPAVLTSVAEACANMIFPFHWQCPYIPLCPLGLSAVLNAPTPFIVGVDSRYFDLYDPPHDVTCVDVDTNSVTLSEDRKGVSLKMFPKKAMKVMRASLERLFDQVCQDEDDELAPDMSACDVPAIDQDFTRKRKELLLETAIQEVFLRFMAMLLKGYNHFLLPITAAPTDYTTDLSSLFDVQGFQKSRDKAYHKFFGQITKTQCFSRFIEERSFVSDKDASLAFFDECTEKVEEGLKEEPRLIELEDSAKSERTVFITPPDASGLPPDSSYSYTTFPELNQDLFLKKTLVHPAVSGLRSSSVGNSQQGHPGSPMTRRTKHEMRSAHKIAQRHANTPILWSKCLLWHCYSVWFIHLPSYIKTVHSKTKALRIAYDVLVRIRSAKLQPPDEVCYRVLMQLCGMYHQPVLAVKVLFEMKRQGVQPNAITYGFYNKAVLESKWPSSTSNAYLKWTRLRNTILAIAQFKRALRSRRLSIYSNSESDFDRMSRGSGDSYLDDAVVPLDKVPAGSLSVKDAGRADGRRKDGSGDGQEELASTGGSSDRGYCSSVDDSKRVSMVIGSQDSIDSIGGKLRAHATSLEQVHQLEGKSSIVSGPQKTNTILTASQGSTGVARKLSLDPKPDDVYESSNIVRRSLGTDAAVSESSQAGLLMTSQPIVHDNKEISFSSNLSKSVDLHTLHEEHEALRSRCAGEEESKVTSSELLWPSPPAESSTDDEATERGSNEEPLLELNIKEEGESSTDPQEAPSEVTACKQGVSDSEALLTSSDTSITGVGDLGSSVLPERTSLCDKHFLDHKECVSDASVEKSAADIDCVNSSAVQSSPSKTEGDTSSITSSPVHSVRTPVTENDPLGLFHPVQETVKQTPTKTSDPTSTIPPPDMEPFKDSLKKREISSSAEALDTTSNVPQKSSKAATLPSNLKASDVLSSSSSPSSKPKSVSRSESLSTALRFGANRFLSKITEIKQNMSTPSKSETGSSGSLSRVGIAESDEGDSQSVASEASLKKVASQDALSVRSGDDLVSDGQHDDIQRPTRSGRYAPFVNKLHDSWKYLKQNETLQYLGQTLKDSLKESLSESWGIAEDESSNEDVEGSGDGCEEKPPAYSDISVMEQKMRAAARPEFPLTPEEEAEIDNIAAGNAPVQSLLDQLVPAADDADHASLDRNSLRQSQQGSQQSITQAFYTVAVDVEMCSLSRCQSCSNLIYDEEIMAGWSADDSNLNTSCQFCNSKFVPFLQIYIKDYRHGTNGPVVLTPSQSCESMHSVQSMPSQPHASQPVSKNKSVSTDKPTCTVSAAVSLPILSNSPHQSNCGTAIESTPDDVKDSITDTSTETDTETVTNAVTDTVTNTEEDSVVTDVTDPVTEEVMSQDVTRALSTDVTQESCDGDKETEENAGHNRTGDDTATVVTGENQPLPPQVTSKDENNSNNPHKRGSMKSSRKSSADSLSKRTFVALEPLSVPYLSPLVLRKEMENVLEQEGDLCLSGADFLDQHPIIYWNMIWYFKRLDIPSHMTACILTAKATNPHAMPPKAWSSADSRHVSVRTVWDNPRLHEALGQPMYILWNSVPSQDMNAVDSLIKGSHLASRGMMQHIITSIMCNDVLKPIRLILSHRSKVRQQQPTGRLWFHSIYREILFLSFIALGRNNIDHDALDKEYRQVYESLNHRDLHKMKPYDRPPKVGVVWCRRMFSELDI